MSSLASVYHKPPGTFIGLGRIGADSMQKREEYVFMHSTLLGVSRLLSSMSEDQFSAQKAFQTVAAGQQAENLLDFDDVPSDQPSGLAATEISTAIPAAANLMAGTSSNPLDDLVSIFGHLGTTQPTPTAVSPTNVFGSSPPLQHQPQQNAFAGLGLGGVASPPQVTSPPPQQGQKEDDLLGLF
jgi:AP-1 complex subunit beta-1